MNCTAIHETGHALGLTHPGDRTSVMYPTPLQDRLETSWSCNGGFAVAAAPVTLGPDRAQPPLRTALSLSTDRLDERSASGEIDGSHAGTFPAAVSAYTGRT